jgi:signal transduction histidine kinase
MPGPAVDGATLRRWRLSRGWDVSRLAREFIKAADEPLATLRGLMHMINAWERGARRPSERHWLLYLQVFPERANGEAANGDPDEAGALAREARRRVGELPGIAEINAMEAAALSSPCVDSAEIRTLAATARARAELRGFAEERAALRRVAALVARTAPPEEVFAAVTEEAGRLLDADVTGMSRYDPDGAHTLIATWTSTGAAVPVPVGTRFAPGGHNGASLVFRTGRPARIDDFGQATGPTAEAARELGARASVAVPITFQGRPWGVMSIGSARGPLPTGTEDQLAGFTELAGTAIANAEAQAALTASRARIVAPTDQMRRRIERDLHDGVQQRLVSLALELRQVRAAVPPGTGELAGRLESAVREVTGLLEEVREIARGLHPAALAEGGLRPALRALARRSAVPIDLDIRVTGRLPEPVEIAAYYAVAEALTN